MKIFQNFAFICLVSFCANSTFSYGMTYNIEFCKDCDLSFQLVQSQVRSYYAPLTPAETRDIVFIVTTLSNSSSFINLLKHKGELERAGQRVNHVHPLKFLMAIFSDEKSKAGVRNIRSRSFVWNEFFKGLKDSFNEESSKGNLKDDQIQDFAAHFNLSPALLTPPLKAGQWDQFVDILINSIPRGGGHSRYDM